MSFRYQKTVKINKKTHYEPPFVQCGFNEIKKVYHDVGADGFILYLYLLGNQNGYILNFSLKSISNIFGMPKSTVLAHWNKLVNKGYLVETKEGRNNYEFYDVPKTNNVELRKLDFNTF